MFLFLSSARLFYVVRYRTLKDNSLKKSQPEIYLIVCISNFQFVRLKKWMIIIIIKIKNFV